MAESVRRINEPEIPELAETLTLAFFDDPIFRWWMPVDGRRKELLPGFFTLIAQAYLPSEEIYQAGEGVAAAVWAPPGGGPSEAEMAEWVPRIGEATAEYADTLFEVLEVMDAKHPTDPHYYLFMLGTRPPFQSRGLGSQLLRTVLDRCDADKVPAYLEASSEGNKRLYLRHGFEVVEAVTVRDSPPFWCMWRNPA